MARANRQPAVARATYPVRRVSELFGISLNGTYEAIKRGEIPAIIIGGRVLPLKEPIDRMLGINSTNSNVGDENKGR